MRLIVHEGNNVFEQAGKELNNLDGLQRYYSSYAITRALLKATNLLKARKEEYIVCAYLDNENIINAYRLRSTCAYEDIETLAEEIRRDGGRKAFVYHIAKGTATPVKEDAYHVLTFLDVLKYKTIQLMDFCTMPNQEYGLPKGKLYSFFEKNWCDL